MFEVDVAGSENLPRFNPISIIHASSNFLHQFAAQTGHSVQIGLHIRMQPFLGITGCHKAAISSDTKSCFTWQRRS